jgi:hypothetical protein
MLAHNRHRINYFIPLITCEEVAVGVVEVSRCCSETNINIADLGRLHIQVPRSILLTTTYFTGMDTPATLGYKIRFMSRLMLQRFRFGEFTKYAMND